jgi:hypothetical protein
MTYGMLVAKRSFEKDGPHQMGKRSLRRYLELLLDGRMVGNTTRQSKSRDQRLRKIETKL